MSLSIHRRDTSFPWEFEPEYLEEECTRLFSQYGVKVDNTTGWSFFTYNPSALLLTSKRVHGYEEPRSLWKLFLNPVRGVLPHVLEKLFILAKEHGIVLEGKINREGR